MYNRAYLDESGKMTYLPTLGGRNSDALNINEHGQVVGKSDVSDKVAHAFLYERGVMYDLNSLIPRRSGWVLEAAHAINDRGQIVCTGNKGLCLLTPVHSH